ncbi:MAG TPA: hypothetical protein VHY91_16105 [Pirellulales bacterium]|jgi:stress-induced morphogen|nr:hypothetical protein [Pirellulales bacterium]
MSIDIPRGEHDPIIDQIIQALRGYEREHPRAKIDLYRQNSASIRIRIIDPDWSGISKAQRHRVVLGYLGAVPDDTQGEISLLLLLTPEETTSSFANFEFDDPIPSGL